LNFARSRTRSWKGVLWRSDFVWESKRPPAGPDCELAAGLFVAPEVVWPALVTGLVAIIGDDRTRPKDEEINP
jgi:hypothetical protein